MPCSECDSLFNVKPCINVDCPTQVIKNIELTKGYIDVILSIYRRLMLDCPCKECLVKMMCTVLCEKYRKKVFK